MAGAILTNKMDYVEHFSLHKKEVFIGCVCLEHSGPKEITLWALEVAQHLRGQGYGYVLMDAIVHKCKNLGARTVNLSVLTDNVIARHYYEQCGFQYIPEKAFYSNHVNMTIDLDRYVDKGVRLPKVNKVLTT